MSHWPGVRTAKLEAGESVVARPVPAIAYVNLHSGRGQDCRRGVS